MPLLYRSIYSLLLLFCLQFKCFSLGMCMFCVIPQFSIRFNSIKITSNPILFDWTTRFLHVIFFFFSLSLLVFTSLFFYYYLPLTVFPSLQLPWLPSQKPHRAFSQPPHFSALKIPIRCKNIPKNRKKVKEFGKKRNNDWIYRAHQQNFTFFHLSIYFFFLPFLLFFSSSSLTLLLACLLS